MSKKQTRVSVKKLEAGKVELTVKVSAEEFDLALDHAFQKVVKEINVPGFRQGKAPKNILEKYVGIAALQREVLDSVLPTIFESAIEENNFDLVSAPNVESFEFADDKTLKVVAKFELKPEVKLCEYKEVSVEVEEYKMEADYVEKELKNLQDRFATLTDVTGRKSKDTDLVNIDFDGYVGGEEIKGGSAKGYLLDLAHSNFIPGFAEQLVDHEIGEEFTIKVKFPAEYHDEKLKGADAEFNIKLNGIKEKVLPELNDELAKKVNASLETLDALKEDIQKFATNTEKAENEKRTAEKVFDYLFENIDIQIQDTMINREIQALMGEFKQRINMQGGNFDEMLEKEGHQKVYEQMKEEAVKRIKTSLIIGKIAQTENMNVTQEDVQGKIGEMAAIYRTTADEIIAEIQKNVNILHSINQQIITEKVTRFLVDNAKVKFTSK